jgi:hypothetical protein
MPLTEHWTLPRYAERIIDKQYGHRVSIDNKAKQLIKFGVNSDIDAGVTEMVWEQGGLEVYPTTNSIDTISSSNAGDTQEVVVEGHYFDANNDLIFSTETTNLNGQNKVTLSQPLCRANRMFNNGSTEFAGAVYVYEDTAIVGGVPSDGAKIHVNILSGTNQSLKAASSISANDYFIITEMVFSVKRATNAAVDFEFQVRQLGKIFRTQVPITVNSSQSTVELFSNFVPFIVPPNSDFRVLATSNTNNVQVDAIVIGMLAQIE